MKLVEAVVLTELRNLLAVPATASDGGSPVATIHSMSGHTGPQLRMAMAALLERSIDADRAMSVGYLNATIL